MDFETRYCDEESSDAAFALSGVCTCSAVRKLARRMTQLYEAALAPSGMTVGQFGLLARIIKQPGTSLQTLANSAGMDQSSLSRSIRLIAKANHIWFESDPDDARVKTLYPTAAGIQAFELAAVHWRKAQEDVGRRLSPDGQEGLRSQCVKVLQVLHDAP